MAKRRRPRKGAGNRSLQIGKRKENFFSEDLQRIRQTVIGLNCRERCRLDSKKSILMGETGRRWTGAAGDREHVWQGLGRSGSGAQERAARANEDFSDPLCQDSGPSVGPEHGWYAVVSVHGWDAVGCFRARLGCGFFTWLRWHFCNIRKDPLGTHRN